MRDPSAKCCQENLVLSKMKTKSHCTEGILGTKSSENMENNKFSINEFFRKDYTTEKSLCEIGKFYMK